MTSENISIPYGEAQAIVAKVKFIHGEMIWKNQPNNGNFFQATFIVYDKTKQTIPGLTVELHYRRGRIESECNYKFTIYSMKGSKKKLRAYQIEVFPPDKWSHNELGNKWYGPHHHFGETAEKIASVSHLGCADHEEWFNQFLAIGSIQYTGSYNPPNPSDPQGTLEF